MAVEFKRILIQPMFDPLAVETIVKAGFHLQGSLTVMLRSERPKKRSTSVLS